MWTLCSQDMAQSESGTRELGSLRPSAVAAQQSESDKVDTQDAIPIGSPNTSLLNTTKSTAATCSL